MKWFKNVWKDPVWSKVISALIVALLASGYASVKAYITNAGLWDTVKSIFVSYIPLWCIVLTFFVILIVYGIIVKYRKLRTFKYDNHSYENDKRLYDMVMKDLTPHGSITFLRSNNFAGFSFHLSSIKELEVFFYKYSDNPQAEFLNPKIENEFKTLLADIKSFQDLICYNTFAVGTDDLQTVPSEWEEEKPEQFWSVVNDLHSAATKVCDDYDRFVRLGKREIKLN